jgi:chorismate synthase
VVSCVVKGLPGGLGEPVFDKLDADLAKAMLAINAVKGFQIGMGFAAASMRGSEHNQAGSGGVLGGISSGEDLSFDVAFKPPSTIAKAQPAMNKAGEQVVLEAKGRHDPCVVPRAVPIVEAMTCLVLADHLLRQRSARI